LPSTTVFLLTSGPLTLSYPQAIFNFIIEAMEWRKPELSSPVGKIPEVMIEGYLEIFL
jgi:hypothetical protein